ncbi:unnamed protein product [Bemisia tabaci]|uniref:Uncharacterized protein n=1 Tax=Bemisia tabaci TaxID=7038 RepID=A0A9P0C8L4_BEMTA|nr:unnamed protein product [Bemisia tabaci]
MQFLISLRFELQKTFEKYKILLNSTMKLHKYALEILTGNFTRIKDERKFRTSLIIGTSNLTKTIFHHFQQRKIMVLIDAFDAPVSKWLVSDWKAVEYEILKTHETVCDFIASLFLNLKNFLAAGFLTGRTRHGNIYAHRAEVISYIRFTENARIASAFALTEANVENLLQIHASSNISLKMLNHFFGGYAVQNSPNLVLNTKLTIESIEKDELAAPRGLDHEGFSHALRLDHAGLEILRVFVGENVTTYLSNKIGLLNLMDLNDNFLPLSAINTTWKNYSRENVQRLTEYMHDLGYFTTKRGVAKGWVELKTPNVEAFESLLQEVTMAVKKEFNLQEVDVRALQSRFLMLSESASWFQKFMNSVQTLFKSVGDMEASKIRGVLFLVLVQDSGVMHAGETTVRSEEIKEPLEGGLNFLLPESETGVVLEVQVNSSALSVFQQLVDEHASQRVPQAKNRILVGINYEPVHKKFSGVFSFNSDKPNTESVTTLSNT